MLNTITIMGRLTKEPELRHTQTGKAVVSFTLAVDRDFGEKQTDFVNCFAWQGTAEFISKYFHKGSMMVANGSLQSREWTDKHDQKRTEWEVNVSNAYFGESKKAASSANPNVYAQDFKEIGDDDGEVPF